MNYDQSMLRICGRRSLAFTAVIPIACTLSFVGVAQVAGSQIQNQAQAHFLAAQQDQQQGRLDDAVHEYQTVLRLQPQIPETYANLGLVYYVKGDFADSAKALESAAKLRPGMRGVSLWLGIDEVRLNHPERGVTYLREAVRLDPKEKLAQSWLGTALWDAGQTDAALRQLRKASAQFPNDPDLLFALGEAYGKASKHELDQLQEDSLGTAISDRIYAGAYVAERDWSKAEGHLRRAIERDPHSVEPYLELAAVFVEQANLPAAQLQLDHAAVVAPDSAAVLARSGELRILAGQQALGLSMIDQALQRDRSEALDVLGLPPDSQIHGAGAGDDLLALCREALEKLQAMQTPTPATEVVLAALYARSVDFNAARQAYEQLMSVPPISRPSASDLAQAKQALHQHNYDQAEAALLRWLAVHPHDLSARYVLVDVRRRISMTQIVRLLTVAPDSYHVHQLLGQLYADREEDDKALTEYLAVAAARPDLPDVHFWLGHLYWKHGDADHALVELTRQLQLDPGHPEANGELGAVLVAENRAEEAIPHLELAIRGKPDLWPAYSQLGRAYATQKNYVRAEEVLRHALAHDHDGSAHYQLGRVLYSEGKNAEANRMFAQVRSLKNEASGSPSSEARANHGEKQ